MNAIQKLVNDIVKKVQFNDEITELEWVLDIAYKDMVGIDKGTLNKAAEDLAALIAQRDELQEKINAVTALVNEWRYLAENRPMSPIRANGYKTCADELAAALESK